MAALTEMVLTTAQQELIGFVYSAAARSQSANSVAALWHRIFPSSFGAQSVAGSPSMRFVFHAAIRQFVTIVRITAAGVINIADFSFLSGQSHLPSTCSVCEHNPVAKEDCKPNKSLRTTVKVYIRTAEKKRDALKSKEDKVSPTITPVDVTPPILGIQEEHKHPEVELSAKAEPPQSQALEQVALASSVEGEVSTEALQDVPQQSIEVRIPAYYR